MAATSNNSGAFGKKTSPTTQELVDDIAASQFPEGGAEELPIQAEPEVLKPCTRRLDTCEAALVALAAIAAWEIIKSIFKN